MNDQNFAHIQGIFQQKTGVKLHKKRPIATRRLLILTAVVTALCLLAAFTYPVFSPLAGDALTLNAEYLGDGIVRITAQNHSHKSLTFDNQVKLMEWITDKEVSATSDQVAFSKNTVPAQSEVSFTIDLSCAYDIASLEATTPRQHHYLVLTNQNFLTGQQWKCSVQFNKLQSNDTVYQETIVSIEPDILAKVEPELQYYFETEPYAGAFSWNPHHYEYLQKVDELLQRCGKRIVQSVNAGLMVEPILDGYIIDENWPAELQYQLGSAQQTTLSDAFGRLVGSTDYEDIKYLACSLSYFLNGVEYTYSLPLLYFSTFPVEQIQSQQDCAFIHGQIVSFEELSDYQVYNDGQYVCYNVTHLFYTDQRTYMRSYVDADPYGSKQEYPMGEEQFRRAKKVLAYYEENLKVMTFEEYAEARPDCRIEGDAGTDVFRKGLQGVITSDCDILSIHITVTDGYGTNDPLGKEIYTCTITPEYPRYYDLSDAQDAAQFIQGLEPGSYTLEIAVQVDAPFHGYMSIYSCIFTA